MSLRRSMIFTLGGALPLDEAGGTALFAFGLRKLRNGYTGSALQVRNSVGAIGNLAFDSNDEVSASSIVTITTAATGFTVGSTHTLTAFANSGDVTVRTWYDQSGGGRNITQSTVANQPFLMQSGSFRLVDGKPSVYSPFTSKRLVYTGNCADYYNLVNNLGSTTIVKHTSTSVNFLSNQLTLWGIQNFTTDSSGIPASNCPATSGLYGFGIANNQVANQAAIGISTRTSPNISETCVIPYSACTVRSIIPIGGSISSSFYNGSGAKIMSISDDNGGRNIKSYINGSLNTTTAYYCSLVRYPFINAGSSAFFIGNVNTPNLPDTSGGTDIDYSFQEFIAYNGTNYHYERNIIERSMGRYYNITVS